MWSSIAKKIKEPVTSVPEPTPNTDYNIQLYVNVNGKLVSVCKRRLFIMSGTPTEETIRDFIKDAPYANSWSIHMTKQAHETYNGHSLPVYKVILSLKSGIVGLPLIDSKTQRTLGIIPRMDTLSQSDIIDYIHLFDLFELAEEDEPAHVDMNEWTLVPQKLIVDGFKPFRLITVRVC
jgi:hypothetical protein